MRDLIRIQTADSLLLAELERTLAEAKRRSGDWLVCRLGCTQCCAGPFAITQLDVWRLRRGMAELKRRDPERADAVRERARQYIEAIAPYYPGEASSGELRDEDALPESFDSVPCPALDPASGACDLYESRPVTCRTFGPVTQVDTETFAACALCYEGASEQEMRSCALEIDPEGREAALLAALEEAGHQGMTIVAFALTEDSGLRSA